MPSLLEQLATELQGAQAQGRYRATGFPSGTPSLPYYHGPGGLFGVPGLERDLISTRVQPRGLASRIPARGQMDMNPLFPFITGFLDSTGTNPNGVCDDPKTAGPGKNCFVTAQFGRYSLQTRELEINRLGQRTNRGEYQDLTLVNPPLSSGGTDMTMPNVPGGAQLINEAAMRMVEVGIGFQNMLARQIYEGNPANNSAGGGYQEFPGLDILIGTGKVDAITNQACPSLDSHIRDFNYTQVGASGPTDDGIVQQLTYSLRYLRSLADDTNMSPVNWLIVMRENLFYELTAIWPCVYMTQRCAFTTTDGTKQVNVDAGDQIAMRDSMRNGNYLLIDGQQVEVVFDNTIREESNTTGPASLTVGTFASDIYIIPLSVRGGTFGTTYWEYVDYSAANGALAGARAWNYGSSEFWTDGGRFLWVRKPQVNWCIQLAAKIEPRIVLRTPHLAARLTNLKYAPLIHNRDPFPTDPYFLNGGNTSRLGQAPSFYKEWSGPTV